MRLLDAIPAKLERLAMIVNHARIVLRYPSSCDNIRSIPLHSMLAVLGLLV